MQIAHPAGLAVCPGQGALV